MATSSRAGHRDMFLRSSRDIEWVKRHGRRISTSLFNMLACQRDEERTRIGIVVGKRFGMAVRRNRAKRVFRELVRRHHHELLPGYALLIFPKREALVQPYGKLERMWEASLIRSHLMHTRSR